MPASDFLESAASGFAALLPRFLVKQLKSSNKLWLDRYKQTAGLPKYFQGPVSLNGAWERQGGDYPAHTGAGAGLKCLKVVGLMQEERDEQLFFLDNLFF